MTTPLLLRAAEIIEREGQRRAEYCRADDSPDEEVEMLDIARQLRERHEKGQKLPAIRKKHPSIVHCERALHDAMNRKGMIVGLPKATVDASNLKMLLTMLEKYQEQGDD